MLAPELLAELWKLHLELSAALALQMLDDPRDCHVRRNIKHEVHMVRAYGALDDVDLVSIADLANDFSKPEVNIVFENFLSVFGYPNDVVHAGVRGVACVTILACHVHILC